MAAATVRSSGIVDDVGGMIGHRHTAKPIIATENQVPSWKPCSCSPRSALMFWYVLRLMVGNRN